MVSISWQRNLYTIFVAELIVIMGFSFVIPFMPLFIQQVGNFTNEEAAFWAGFANAAGGIAMFFSAPLWGIVADRWGRKPMVLRAMFGASVILALTGLAPNIAYVVGLRFALGLVSGTVAAASALVATVTPRDKISFAMGLLMMAVFSGTTMGPLFGGLAADRNVTEGAARKLDAVRRGEHDAGLILLEHDHSDSVPALIGILQQGHHRALSGLHAFGDGHRPGGIDDEEHQVGGLAHADLAVVVVGAQRQGWASLVLARLLKGSRCAQRGVEGQVGGIAGRRRGLNVAATLTVGAGLAAPPAARARQAVKRGVKAAGVEFLSRGDLAAALPPAPLRRPLGDSLQGWLLCGLSIRVGEGVLGFSLPGQFFFAPAGSRSSPASSLSSSSLG